VKLYNTATRKIEEFKPLKPPEVAFYTCGPTVYDFSHLGHLRTYTNSDVLKRTLQYLGYKVKHVMNITDVGHLTSDSDEGQDKMEKGAEKRQMTVWDLAKTYTDFFFYSTEQLNIKKPDIIAPATEHIPDFIKLIEVLLEKGFGYETGQAVYFDVKKFTDYGKLSGQKLEEKEIGVREEVHVDKEKRNPADFALWFKRVGRFKDHVMYWPSPWGDGFPGWHIECSAMCMKYLGETIDIHGGGIDHIPVHHENEIAQSEAATGKQFARYWFHNDFLLVEGQKMSKSLDNFLTIDHIKKRDIDPLALRLLYFQTHYRQIMNFTWDALYAAKSAYERLKAVIVELKEKEKKINMQEEYSEEGRSRKQKFIDAISDDLQMPRALAVLWETVKSNLPAREKLHLLLDFDEVLGLGLKTIEKEIYDIPEEVIKLAQEREEARLIGDFARADRVRDEIHKRGFAIKDTDHGFEIARRK